MDANAKVIGMTWKCGHQCKGDRKASADLELGNVVLDLGLGIWKGTVDAVVINMTWIWVID